MAGSSCKKDSYKTPFYCALCGLPFARVFRTDEQHGKWFQDCFGQWHQASPVQTILGEQNGILLQEEVERLTGVNDCLELKLSQSQYTGNTSQEYNIRRAYDGQKISGEDIQWIGSIRALVHRFAKAQPEGGHDQLDDNSNVYLTGRGRVAQDSSWAYASPSIDTEIEEADEEGWSVGQQMQYGFHLYQEPDRDDRRYFYSSIPFHDQCWDILDLAVRVVQESRGLPDSVLGEDINFDHLWSLLVSTLPAATPGKLSDLTTEALRQGMHTYAVIGMPWSDLIGSEVKQCAGRNGWLHIEGLEVGP